MQASLNKNRLNQAQDYCKNIAAKSGSSFYYSFLFLNPLQKQGMYAIYALCRTLDDLVDQAQDLDIAKKKLAWWQEEIYKLFHQEQAISHPITLALHHSLADFKFQEQDFLDLIQGMSMDLSYQGYSHFEDVERYCHNVASTVGLLSIEIFGYSNPSTREFAKKLGLAFQWINIIRDVGEDALRNRIYIPESELQAFSIAPHNILKLEYTPNFQELIQKLGLRAKGLYAEALAALSAEDRFAQKTALIMGQIYLKLLSKIEKKAYRTLHQRISLWPIHKFWLAWKTHQYETTLHHSRGRLERA
ncbi:MAG: presqualene diphosphate synthase HpnD [Gammaproteobacteria bacterium]